MVKKMVQEGKMTVDEALDQDMFDLMEIMNTNEEDKFDNPSEFIDAYK